LQSAAVAALIANVDRMHDEDVWPCSIPKTRGGPPSGLLSDRGGVAERQGWRCRATGVELQSDRGGVEHLEWHGAASWLQLHDTMTIPFVCMAGVW